MNLSISRLRLGGSQVVNAGPSISIGLEYDKSAPSIRLFLTAARRGGVADALAVTQFDVEGADNLASVTDEVSAELADTTAPGALTGATGQKVTAMSGAVTGGLYLVSYEVTAADPDVTLFAFPGGPLKFVEGQFSTRVGIHHVLATAEDAGTGDAIRKGGTGNITISAMSIKRAEWTVPTNLMTAGDEITFTIARGEASRGATVTVPTANEIYVAPGGSDTLGTGAQASPYRQWAGIPRDGSDAITLSAGDVVEFAAGTYEPFSESDLDGADGSPITVRAATGAERQVVFEGTLESHVYYGGGGPPDGFVSEDAISLLRCSWINLQNLHTTQVARHGINITECSNINVQGPKVDHTGDAGIYVVGKRFSTPIATDGSEDDLTTDVRVWDFDVSNTNKPTDSGFTDDMGRRGGANEAITVGNGVDGFILEDGDSHDTLQYGFDFKSGVKNAVARRIRLWNIEKFGFYVDAGERGARNIDVHDITIFNAQTGFSLAREIDGTTDVHDLSDIRIWNILMFNINGIGIYGQKHPKDVAAIAAGRSAAYENISIRFVTVYNANRTGGFASVRLDDFSGIGTGIDLVGVVVHDSDKDVVVVDNWTGETGFTVDDNLNLASGTPTDPLFVAPDTTVVLPTTHRGPMTLPDFTLQEASPAAGIVTTASYIATPFDVGAGGNIRVLDADAGAYAPVPDFVSNIDGTAISVTDNGDGTSDIDLTGAVTYSTTIDTADLDAAETNSTPLIIREVAATNTTGDTWAITAGSLLYLIPAGVSVTEVFALERGGVDVPDFTLGAGNSYTLQSGPGEDDEGEVVDFGIRLYTSGAPSGVSSFAEIQSVAPLLYGDAVSADLGSGDAVGTIPSIGIGPHANWVQYSGFPSWSATNMEDQSGNATTMDCVFANGLRSGNITTSAIGPGDTFEMFRRGVRADTETDSTFSITQIPYSKYDVVFYIENAEGSSSSVGDHDTIISDGTTTYYVASDGSPKFTGTLEQITNQTPLSHDGRGNYIVFSGLTSASVTITSRISGTVVFNCSFVGFQVIERLD
jgi:hypothetical protein